LAKNASKKLYGVIVKKDDLMGAWKALSNGNQGHEGKQQRVALVPRAN
jgi:hypothetical protein